MQPTVLIDTPSAIAPRTQLLNFVREHEADPELMQHPVVRAEVEKVKGYLTNPEA